MPPLTAARILRRLRLLVGRRAFERDLDDELRFHLDMAAEHHRAHGVEQEHARALTQREFGSMNRFKEEVRDAHGLTLADDLARDVRLSMRSLRRSLGFTALALLTFALGIGANAAIFSVVNAVLLRPLPYPNGPRLVQVNERLKDSKLAGSVSVQNWRDWREQARSFSALGAYVDTRVVLGGDAEPERVLGSAVSAEVLPMLGVRPRLGRTFTRDEEVRGKNRVAILSDGLWHRRFGGDPRIVGSAVSIEGAPYVVVGVMPPGFNFPLTAQQTEIWTPFVPPPQADDPRSRGWHWIAVIGMLEPGVTREQAEHEMVQIAARIEQQNPQSQANRTAMVRSLRDVVVGDLRPTLFALLGAVLLVLLIACANVANLLLARNASRRKDVAVRVALGATRGRLMRQLLTESVVLAFGGALLGLALAKVGTSAMTSIGAESLPIGGDVPLDGRVMLVLLVSTVLCGLAFGLAPALQSWRGGVRDDLSNLSTRTTGGGEMQRFRSALVVAQIALSLMLLVGAGLLMRAFVALQSTPSGLVSERVLTARLSIPRRFLTNGSQTDALLRPLLERLRAIPGVKEAGITSMLPIEETGAQASFWVDRRPWPKGGSEPIVEVRTVSPGYFVAMGVPIKSGRALDERDDSTRTRKVVVNEALARLLFPGENPVGRQLLQGNSTQHDDYEIVGVVGDVRQSGLDTPPQPEVFAPYSDPRPGWWSGEVALVVKAVVPELTLVSSVRRTLHEIAPDAALSRVESMNEVIARSLTSRKLTLVLFAIFAAIALALAASGLYGVIYYLVTQRTREIGIRVALGADKTRVMRLVLSQGATLVAIGLATGLLGAVLLSRLLASLLYGVGAHDPLTFVTVPALLGVIAMLATAVPAWRAARVDPVIALRSE